MLGLILCVLLESHSHRLSCKGYPRGGSVHNLHSVLGGSPECYTNRTELESVVEMWDRDLGSRQRADRGEMGKLGWGFSISIGGKGIEWFLTRQKKVTIKAMLWDDWSGDFQVKFGKGKVGDRRSDNILVTSTWGYCGHLNKRLKRGQAVVVAMRVGWEEK